MHRSHFWMEAAAPASSPASTPGQASHKDRAPAVPEALVELRAAEAALVAEWQAFEASGARPHSPPAAAKLVDTIVWSVHNTPLHDEPLGGDDCSGDPLSVKFYGGGLIVRTTTLRTDAMLVTPLQGLGARLEPGMDPQGATQILGPPYRSSDGVLTWAILDPVAAIGFDEEYIESLRLFFDEDGLFAVWQVEIFTC